LTRFAFRNPNGITYGYATFDLLLQNSSITKQKSIGSFIVTLMNSPITKRCFVILSAMKNLLFRCCFRDSLTMPPFRDPHGMSIAHATCDHSLSALSKPAAFVVSLARDDIVRVLVILNVCEGSLFLLF